MIREDSNFCDQILEAGPILDKKNENFHLHFFHY